MYFDAGHDHERIEIVSLVGDHAAADGQSRYMDC
jgi:hypothetical protein